MAIIPPAPTVSHVPPSTSFPTIATTSLQPTTTKRPPRTRTTANPAEPTSSNNSSDPNNDSGGGMSGGAVAGLVIGALFVLVCSVAGGLLLLKKRRKRMMVAGRGWQYHAGKYPDSAQKFRGGQYGGSDDPDDDRNKGQGGISKLLSEFVARARKTVNSNSASFGAPEAPSMAIAATGVAVQQQQSQMQQPAGPALPRMLERGRHSRALPPIPGMVSTYDGTSPAPSHQSGSLPPSGSPPMQGLYYAMSTDNSYFPQQHQQPYQQPYQQQPQQGQLPSAFAQNITTPASQPYYYQPGTGLVPVPQPILTPPQQQQVQPQQALQQPMQYPPQPHQSAQVAGTVGHTASLSQQPYQQQQQQNSLISQPPAPVSFPAPMTHAIASSSYAATTPALPVSELKSTTPEPSGVFLPGDASRPLLGQGLFKIVPDVEDQEEARRGLTAAEAATGSTAAAGDHPSTADSVQPVQLNLGDDFLSSVINYETQDERFQALEARQGTTAMQNGSNLNAATRNTESARPRYMVEKEEHSSGKQELDEKDQEEGNFSVQSTSSLIVIVGSDIVLEPLPSVKAAAKAAAAAAATGGQTASQTTGQDADQDTTQAASHEGATNIGGAMATSPAQSSHERPLTQGSIVGEKVLPKLHRVATIGAPLPTLGTEENLERTDDKEEYLFMLHGRRSDLAGSSPNSTPVVHPPTTVSLAEGFQGDMADAFLGACDPSLYHGIKDGICEIHNTFAEKDCLGRYLSLLRFSGSTPGHLPSFRILTVPVYVTIGAILLSLKLAFVGFQASGETDINPTGAVTKVT
ncbi:hypothetical protein EDD11_000774 [Mortierella claussenii]|nr:hypothetical protein EDD11_000774 [Mortierella claussenii]